MDSYGYLLVNARTALGALPVKGAVVRVRGQGTDVSSITDDSGVSERMRLPAPDREAGLTPDTGVLPYATYDVSVSAEGYYPWVSRSVPVFPDIVSVQNVNLVPIAGYSSESSPTPDVGGDSVPYGLEEGNDGR